MGNGVSALFLIVPFGRGITSDSNHVSLRWRGNQARIYFDFSNLTLTGCSAARAKFLARS